jgi:5-methyltetrahydrofolate--homocysteine methyltransferase
MPYDFMMLSKAILKGDLEAIKGLAQQALDTGASPQEVLNQGLMAGMDEVGKKFKTTEMFIPEVLRSAKAMHLGLDVLRPLLAAGQTLGRGKVVIGTVKGDLHDLGKNLVAMMLEGAGFEVVDLGIDRPPEAFVTAIKEHKPDIVGMSALLTTTMPNMALTIKAITEAGLRDKVKIMAGGAPVTQEFVDKIGGDGYGSSAPVAVDVAKALINKLGQRT